MIIPARRVSLSRGDGLRVCVRGNPRVMQRSTNARGRFSRPHCYGRWPSLSHRPAPFSCVSTMEQMLYSQLNPKKVDLRSQRPLQRDGVLPGSGSQVYQNFRQSEMDKHAKSPIKSKGGMRMLRVRTDSGGSDGKKKVRFAEDPAIANNLIYQSFSTASLNSSGVTPGTIPYELSPKLTPGFGTTDVGYDHLQNRAGWVKSAGSMKGKGMDDYLFRQSSNKDIETFFQEQEKQQKAQPLMRKSRSRLLPGQRSADKDKLKCPICSSISRSRPLALHECRHTQNARKEFENRVERDKKVHMKPTEKKFHLSKSSVRERERVSKNMSAQGSPNVLKNGRAFVKSAIVPACPPRQLNRHSRGGVNFVEANRSTFLNGQEAVSQKTDFFASDGWLGSSEQDPYAPSVLPNSFSNHARKNFMTDANWSSGSWVGPGANQFQPVKNKSTDQGNRQRHSSDKPSENNMLTAENWGKFVSEPNRSGVSTGSRVQTSHPGSRDKPNGKKSTNRGSGNNLSSPNARNRRVRISEKLSPSPILTNEDTRSSPRTAVSPKKRMQSTPKMRVKSRESDFANKLVVTISNFVFEEAWTSLVQFKYKFTDSKGFLKSSPMIKVASRDEVLSRKDEIALVLDQKMVQTMKTDYLVIQLVDGNIRNKYDAVLGDVKIPLQSLATGNTFNDMVEVWHSETLNQAASFDVDIQWRDMDLSWKMIFNDEFSANLGFFQGEKSPKRSSPKARRESIKRLKNGGMDKSDDVMKRAQEAKDDEERVLLESYVGWGTDMAQEEIPNEAAKPEPTENKELLALDHDATIANWSAEFTE